MKTLRWTISLTLLFVAVYSFGLLARDYLSKSTPAQSEAPNLPELGWYTILAYLHDGYKVVTLYRDAGIVCVENTSENFGNPSVGTGAAFSCWDVEAAPKRIQELVLKYEQQKVAKSALDCGYAPCS